MDGQDLCTVLYANEVLLWQSLRSLQEREVISQPSELNLDNSTTQQVAFKVEKDTMGATASQLGKDVLNEYQVSSKPNIDVSDVCAAFSALALENFTAQHSKQQQKH